MGPLCNSCCLETLGPPFRSVTYSGTVSEQLWVQTPFLWAPSHFLEDDKSKGDVLPRKRASYLGCKCSPLALGSVSPASAPHTMNQGS